jgi:hypothetical protein
VKEDQVQKVPRYGSTTIAQAARRSKRSPAREPVPVVDMDHALRGLILAMRAK